MDYGDLYNHGRWGMKDGWWKPFPIDFEDLPLKDGKSPGTKKHEEYGDTTSEKGDHNTIQYPYHCGTFTNFDWYLDGLSFSRMTIPRPYHVLSMAMLWDLSLNNVGKSWKIHCYPLVYHHLSKCFLYEIALKWLQLTGGIPWYTPFLDPPTW